MNQLIAVTGHGTITIGTREIADMLGKRHDNIKVSAERLVASGVIGGGTALQETPYRDQQNGQTYFEYRLNKRDSLVLVAQNCPEFTARIVDRWQELEGQVAATGIISDDLRRIAEAKAMGLMTDEQAYNAAREAIGLSVEPSKKAAGIIQPLVIEPHYDDYNGELISATELEHYANVAAGSASKMMLKHGLARNVKLGYSGKRRLSRLVLTSAGRKIAVQDGTKFIRFKRDPAIRWLRSVAPQLRY